MYFSKSYGDMERILVSSSWSLSGVTGLDLFSVMGCLFVDCAPSEADIWVDWISTAGDTSRRNSSSSR